MSKKVKGVKTPSRRKFFKVAAATGAAAAATVAAAAAPVAAAALKNLRLDGVFTPFFIFDICPPR